jgi:hypothetical protein
MKFDKLEKAFLLNSRSSISHEKDRSILNENKDSIFKHSSRNSMHNILERARSNSEKKSTSPQTDN